MSLPAKDNSIDHHIDPAIGGPVTGPAARIAPRPQPEGDPASFVVMGWGGPGGITPYGLARRSLGSQVLWLFGVSASAPTTVLAGGTVATFAATGVIAVPLSFPLLAVALGLFAIGYTRLARDVPHAATFAALLTHGLGRTVGAAAAFVAVLSYNCVQIGLYGLLGATLAGQLGGPWWGWALAAWTVVAVIGYRGVTLGAPVVAVVLTLELGMIVLFDVVALTHPAQAEAGAWLQPWSPDLLAVDGVGGVLAFGVAAFLGFETTAAFGEEVRSDRSVGRATGLCLAFLGIFYGISAWALAVAVGPDHIVDAARDPGSGIPLRTWGRSGRSTRPRGPPPRSRLPPAPTWPTRTARSRRCTDSCAASNPRGRTPDAVGQAGVTLSASRTPVMSRTRKTIGLQPITEKVQPRAAASSAAVISAATPFDPRNPHSSRSTTTAVPAGWDSIRRRRCVASCGAVTRSRSPTTRTITACAATSTTSNREPSDGCDARSPSRPLTMGARSSRSRRRRRLNHRAQLTPTVPPCRAKQGSRRRRRSARSAARRGLRLRPSATGLHEHPRARPSSASRRRRSRQMRNAACRDRADAAGGDRFAALDDQPSAVEREAAHPLASR